MWVTRPCQYQCGRGSRGQWCQAAPGSFFRCEFLSVVLSECSLHSSTFRASVPRPETSGGKCQRALMKHMWPLNNFFKNRQSYEIVYGFISLLASWKLSLDATIVTFSVVLHSDHSCWKHSPQVIAFLVRLIGSNELKSHYPPPAFRFM